MNEIKDLLLQILVILFPIFYYHMFLADKYFGSQKRQKQTAITILAAISILLCMTFSIYPISGYRYDLRHVALLFGILYGGYTSGIILFIILVAYRFYLGGPPGTYNSLFVILLILPVIFLSYKRFLHANRMGRTRIAVLLSIYIAFIIITVAATKEGSLPVLQFFILGCLIIGSTWVSVFLTENIRENFQLRLEVQNTEKLRVLGDLTSSFAHEIRNPMQVNRGFLQLLNESNISDDLKRYVQISIGEMDRANEIISDYLSFAKPELDQKNPVELNNLLDMVQNIMSSYARMHNVELTVHLDDPVWIFSNEQKMKQCLINIVKNGIEAMSQSGGLLFIRCTFHEDEVIITIQDEGVGMTEEQISRLGSPFYSLKQKGTGLGLMISYRIIASFDGRITVYSELGKGTIFVIHLPRYFPLGGGLEGKTP